MTEVSVVVPVFGCESSLFSLCFELRDVLTRQGGGFEILFVVDGCPDSTWQVICGLAQQVEEVRGIRLSRNFGQHPAIMAGLRAARGNKIIVMDCDKQDPIVKVPDFLELLDQFDIVFSQLTKTGDSYWRRIQSGVYVKLVSWFTGNKVNRRLGSFTAINRNVAIEYGKFTEPDHHFLYLLNWLGFKTAVIEFERSPRLHGKSSYRFRDRVKHAVRGALFFSSRLVGILLLIGLVAVLCGLLLFVVFLVRTLGGNPVPGWLSVISSVIVFSGLNILLTSIIGLYVVRTYENSKNRPLYVIAAET